MTKAAREGCICICMSSHRAMLPAAEKPPQSISDYEHRKTAADIRGAVLSSPMSIGASSAQMHVASVCVCVCVCVCYLYISASAGIPAGTEDPIVLDMATSFSGNTPKDIFKSLGLQAAVVALG